MVFNCPVPKCRYFRKVERRIFLLIFADEREFPFVNDLFYYLISVLSIYILLNCSDMLYNLAAFRLPRILNMQRS